MGSGSSARPYYDSSYSNELVPPTRQNQQLTHPDGPSLLSPLPEDSTHRAGEKYHVPYPADPTMLRIPYLTRYPFQDYRFAKKVGNGRFGSVVYKAIKLHEYIKTNERYAVKEIMTQEIKAIEYDDLRYEINILSQLTHENIVQYKEVYEPTTSQNAKMYIVIEYLRGGELLTALVNEGRYTFYDILYYLQQVASAIDYLRRHGVVHGNIIPENIIVQEKFNGASRKDNVIKLVGFDHAECFPSGGHKDSLSPVSVASRRRPVQRLAKDPKFCPPEYRDDEQDDGREHSTHTHKKTILESASLPNFLTQTLGGSNQVPQKTLENYRPAVDVWGFAAIFYFLMTGTMPFIEVLHYWEKVSKCLLNLYFPTITYSSSSQ